MHLLAVDDGIWQGNFNLADICFLIAAIVFLIAAILDFRERHPHGDGNHVHYRTYTLPLIALGLALTAAGLLVI